MPVYCIAFGCDNHQRSAPQGVSFHRLLLKKPETGKIFLINVNKVCVCWLHIKFHAHQWLDKLRLVDPPIQDSNARVCSQHFSEDCFVSAVISGFGPSRRSLKAEAVPTLFSFKSAPKRRKLSEAREMRAEQCSIVEELLAESSTPPTRDVGIQCGKLILMHCCKFL